MDESLFLDPAPERHAYPDFRKRLKTLFGERVWLARTDEPWWAPYDSRPWALWTRDREGNNYPILDLVGPQGQHRDVGDWAIHEVQRRHSDHVYGRKRGSGKAWAKRRREQREALQAERMEVAKDRARERYKDLLLWGNKSRQVFGPRDTFSVHARGR